VTGWTLNQPVAAADSSTEIIGDATLFATDSLALQRATAQLRQALTRFFPAQDHQARIFGFSH
jgi:hypothetical protein